MSEFLKEFQPIQIIGVTISAIGLVLIVLNKIDDTTDGNFSVEIFGAKINFPRSAIVFMTGVVIMVLPPLLTKPTDQSIPKSIIPKPTQQDIIAAKADPPVVQTNLPSPRTEPPIARPDPPAPRTESPVARPDPPPSRTEPPSTAIPSDVSIGWCYFGYIDKQDSSRRNFQGGTGQNYTPLVGDRITAVTNVALRSGPIEYTVGGWTNQPQIGLVREGESYVVKAVAIIKGRFYWAEIIERR